MLGRLGGWSVDGHRRNRRALWRHGHIFAAGLLWARSRAGLVLIAGRLGYVSIMVAAGCHEDLQLEELEHNQ